MEDAIFSGDYSDLIDAVSKYMRRVQKERQLIAIILAHPKDTFAREYVLPFVGHWHYRSGDSILFLFAGFKGDPSIVDLGTAPDNQPDFQEGPFNDVIEHLEDALNDFRFSGRTTVILLVTTIDIRHPYAAAELLMNRVIPLDLEGLVEDDIVADVQTSFARLIEVAKEYQEDEALYRARDEFLGSAISNGFTRGVFALLEKYFPPAKSVRAVGKAYWALRVRDMRPE